MKWGFKLCPSHSPDVNFFFLVENSGVDQGVDQLTSVAVRHSFLHYIADPLESNKHANLLLPFARQSPHHFSHTTVNSLAE